MTMTMNSSTLMYILHGSQRPPAARFAQTSIMMRSFVWLPLFVSMQSGTTLLKSSRLAMTSFKTSICKKVRQAVESGEDKNFVMESYADIMMNVCLAAVVLSCLSHTIDVYQFQAIIAQAWTQAEQNSHTKIIIGISRMTWDQNQKKRTHHQYSIQLKKTIKQREERGVLANSTGQGIYATAKFARLMVTVEVDAALKFSQKATNGAHPCWSVTTVLELSTQYSF